MKIYSQIQERVNAQFINAQLPNTGIKAPRKGYYLIKSIGFKPMGPTGQVLLAQANWKAGKEDYFAEGFIVEIAISNLMFDNAEHPPLIENEDLVGKTLYIYNPVFDVKYIYSVQVKYIKALCHYVYEPAKFINEANAALICISQGGDKEKNNYQNLISTAGYDLEDAIDWESNYMPVEEDVDSFDDADQDYDDVSDASKDDNDDNSDNNK